MRAVDIFTRILVWSGDTLNGVQGSVRVFGGVVLGIEGVRRATYVGVYDQ